MTNLDELEDLLRRSEREKAYELINEDKGITAKILINEGISFGIIKEYDLSISYIEFAGKIAEDKSIKEEARENLAVTYNNQGFAYHELKQYERAIEDFNKAIELNPNLAVAYNNRGFAYHELKQYERAIEDHNKAIELNPNLSMAYNNRGIVYGELEQHERAIEDYNKAIEVNPKYVEAYNNRGIAYRELKQYERAIEDYNKAIEVNPKYAMVYNNRGVAYGGLKQYEKAIEDFSKVIELNPKYAGAYYNRGVAYGKIKQYESAIEDYNKAIDLNPKDADAYNNRGNAYGKIKEHESAIEDYNKAIELNPKDAGAYNNRGLAYGGLKQYEKAIEDFSKAIELNPKDAEAYNNRGVAYREIKQHEKAIEDYNKAIERNPKYAEAYNNRGNAYREIKQHEKAIEDYSNAIELNPKYADAYANRGITQLQTNEELEKAIEDFKHARDLFEGRDKERMLGFIEWAEARKEMTMKNWGGFRKRMNEARETFEKIGDPLSLSINAFIKFSYLDEELDNTLNITEPIEALEEIETVLRNLPKVEGLIDPERTIFGARIISFAILRDFISSMRGIDENTDSGVVKAKLTELLEESREVEKAFESVNFVKGKTAIGDIQEIISLVKQEMEGIKWAANKNQKALDILKEYWSRLSSAIKVMNGNLSHEIEKNTLGKEIRQIKSEMQVGIAEIKETISKGFKKSSEEHKEILEKIYETENILMQKNIAKYIIEIKAPLISSLSPISGKIEIPMGTLTEAQIEEKAEEIVRKIKYVKDEVMDKAKEDIFNALKCIPEKIGGKLLKRLKKTKV
ncbi:Photosystem I assembly protein Ycf3 [ANME-1 cluster archaeon GoMg1]|nr:Photosystem I assembly protein Ycf3 [ANME-1 cluster archaeon GoMg1]